MANRDFGQYLRDASEVSLNAASKTADFYTEWLPIKHDFVGIAVSILNVGGSSMTLDCKLEFSPDGGTTAFAFSDIYNSANQAALAQFASIDDGGSATLKTEYWINPYPGEANWKWRVFFDFGGSTVGTNTVSAWYFNKITAAEHL